MNNGEERPTLERVRLDAQTWHPGARSVRCCFPDELPGAWIATLRGFRLIDRYS